jgi:hypothetical protein
LGLESPPFQTHAHMALWVNGAGSWWCSSCSACNWASRATCRWCQAKKSYAQAVQFGSKGFKNKQGPVLGSWPPPQSEPSKQQAPELAVRAATIDDGGAGTVAGMKMRLGALKAARQACSQVSSPATRALDEEIAATAKQLHGAKPAGEQLDGLRAVIERSEKRLAKAKADFEEATSRIEAESAALIGYRADLKELENSFAASSAPSGVEGLSATPPWVAKSLMDAAAHIRAGSEYQKEALAAYLESLAAPFAPSHPQALLQHQSATGDDAEQTTSTDEDMVPQLAEVKRRCCEKTYVETPQLNPQAGGA